MNHVQKALKQSSSFLMVVLMSLAYFLPIVSVSANTSNHSGTAQTLSVNLQNPTATVNAKTASLDGDTLRAYKVINITYNASTNDFTETFSTAFQAYLTSTSSNLTVSGYYSLSSNSMPTLKSCLAGFATYVKTYEGLVDTDYLVKQANSEGIATFSEVPMGQYLVLGWGTTAGPKIYSIATAEVAPTVSGSDYVLYESYDVELKTAQPSIDKTITGGTKEISLTHSANIGDTIGYKIDADVPTYCEGAVATMYGIGDTISSGLTLDPSSIVVSVPSGNDYIPLTNTAGDPYYTLTYLDDPYTFKLTFVYSKIKAYSSIRVTYNAILNENAKVGENNGGNDNKATLLYSSDPFNNSLIFPLESTPVTVYTYGVMINKCINNTWANRLAGAEFKIYTDSGCGTAVKNGNQQDVVLTTNAEGFAFYAGLKNGKYYLKETKAPTGYNLLDDAIEVYVGGPDSLITSSDGTFLNAYTSAFVSETSTPRATSGNNYGWITTAGELVWDPSQDAVPNAYPGAVKAYVKNTISASNTVDSFNSYNGSNGFYWVNVSNATGVTLPSTGGMGTIIFTVVGLVLVIGAAVLLITKARIANKRKS